MGLRMKRTTKALVLTLAAALASSPSLARAAIITKADNALPLYDPASWLGGVAPTANDIALFDNHLLTNSTFTLGADVSWAGIQLTNPANNISFLSDAHSLT